MQLSDFISFHAPAFEADEIRHNLILGIMTCLNGCYRAADEKSCLDKFGFYAAGSARQRICRCDYSHRSARNLRGRAPGGMPIR